MLKKFYTVALIITALLPSTASAEYSNPFTDVPVDSFFSPYIYYLRDSHIASGNGDSFYPEKNLTRAELSKIIVLARRLEPVTATGIFCDVDTSYWAAGYIETLKLRNVINGQSGDCGTVFNPELPVSRAEAMKMLLLTFEFPTSDIADKDFNDVMITDWFYPYVAAAVNQNVVNGYPDGGFHPYDAIKRQEMAKILVRFMDPSDFQLPKQIYKLKKTLDYLLVA